MWLRLMLSSKNISELRLVKIVFYIIINFLIFD